MHITLILKDSIIEGNFLRKPEDLLVLRELDLLKLCTGDF